MVLDCSNTAIFGVVKNIVLENETVVYFVCNVMETLLFDSHVHAFQVKFRKEGTERVEVVKYSNLHAFMPCLLTTRGDYNYISTRWAL